jgi:dipeptidyl aminopeptidase/acylaminoacyl peptidase
MNKNSGFSLGLPLMAMGVMTIGFWPMVGWVESPSASAAPTEPDESRAAEQSQGLPPLLDRRLFFADPLISGASLSPDGRFLAFRKPLDGVLNVWVKPLSAPMDTARPVTSDTERPITFFQWSRDSQFILYSQDKGGDENFHIYAVAPEQVLQQEAIPAAQDLTPYGAVQAGIIALPKATPDTMIVALNDRDPQFHDVYRIDITTGERQLLIQNDQEIGGWTTDLEGNVRLGQRSTGENGTEILKVTESGDWQPLYTCRLEETCYPMRFHRDGRRVYLVSNRGEGTDLKRLMLLDTETGTTELVEQDPESQVDLGGAIFSNQTEELLATYYLGDRLRFYPRDERLAADLDYLKQQFPDQELRLSSRTADDQLMLVWVSSDVNPGGAYLFDRAAQTIELVYESRPDLSTEYLADMQSIRYPARDGLMIPAYLTLPQGVPHQQLPTVVMPHGGPWSRDYWGYDGQAQFLANRGYAVLQPNFRGSTGYGKTFLNAGNQEWGTGAMQHDITDGVMYLIEQGIADPERIGIYGGSYGGYATLAGLAFTPELYAAGVSVVGPSNLITLLQTMPPYWASFRDTMALRLGDPENPDDIPRLRAQSPLYAADNIQAPLLVVQGANDPRVKQAESDQIVAALSERGRPVTYLVAEDEGHGFYGEANRLAYITEMEVFLAEYLGGRYQVDIDPEIQAALDALRVDPQTVQVENP